LSLSFKGEGDSRGEVDKQPLPLDKGKGIKGMRRGCGDDKRGFASF